MVPDLEDPEVSEEDSEPEDDFEETEDTPFGLQQHAPPAPPFQHPCVGSLHVHVPDARYVLHCVSLTHMLPAPKSDGQSSADDDAD